MIQILDKNILKINRRQWTFIVVIFSLCILIGTMILGSTLNPENISTNVDTRNLSPSLEHLFGTDWLGRDMFTRTFMGLSLSIKVGLLGAVGSTVIAVLLGMIAATMGRTADRIVSWLIDLFLSVPHLVMLILISFTLGGGFKGTVTGLVLTHWPSLARIIRAEVMQVRSEDYVKISRKMGKSKWWIAFHHILPHLLPQIIIGFMLLFPHAILHEASITFLGFGLSPHKPAIGIILSESMKFLSSGMWWLAFFPGLCLLLIVRAFDTIGENVQTLIDPVKAHE